jgi:RHS repeat-associated protein
VPLHEWVEGSLDPTPVPVGAPAANGVIAQREALLSKFLLRGPPERGTADSPITWLFEPGTFAPLARVIGDRRESVVTDHLGTPVTLLDDTGALTWSADLTTWGELTLTAGDAWRCPFRWPGQYEDPETGLYYNRFRYYDPASGQYTSHDPLGIAASPNPYWYVPNPIIWTDPFGLSYEDNIPNRDEALASAYDRAGIPRGTGPDLQWDVGDDYVRRGTNGYLFTRDRGTHGRYMQFETENGSRVIAEHTADPRAAYPHFHAGQPKADPTRMGVDFGWSGDVDSAERYSQIGGRHHINYQCGRS